MIILPYKLQQLHIACHSESTYHITFTSSNRVPFSNGFNRLHPVDILVCCEHNLYFLWNRFKHIGYNQYLEIVTTSKEIMSFYDHGVLVFRFDHSRSQSSRNIGLTYLLVKGELLFVTKN